MRDAVHVRPNLPTASPVRQVERTHVKNPTGAHPYYASFAEVPHHQNYAAGEKIYVKNLADPPLDYDEYIFVRTDNVNPDGGEWRKAMADLVPITTGVAADW